MGGRGARLSGRYSSEGRTNAGDILKTTSFISAREKYTQTVDEALGVFRDVNNQYGLVVEDLHMATIRNNKLAVAYWDGENIGWNERFMDNKSLERVYANDVKKGFHPRMGNRTAVEAVASHELGHALTAEAGKKLGGLNVEQTATRIVNEARRQTGHKGVVPMAKNISRYATFNNAEAIAEAFADVYCNGKNAQRESRTIVSVLNKYMGKK